MGRARALRAGEPGAGRRSAPAGRLAELWALERRLAAAGHRHVVGLDEVGVGPLAGPVMAAAVALPLGLCLVGLDDSKRVAAPLRAELDAQVRAGALAVGLGGACTRTIDRLGIGPARRLALVRALASLVLAAGGWRPGLALVDGSRLPGLGLPQLALVGGDRRSASIAAASIVAKEARDRLMVALDRVHPGYGLARHKGYPTAQHLAALAEHGPSPLHRRAFAPVRRALLARARGPERPPAGAHVRP